jgi:hypothetical protein
VANASLKDAGAASTKASLLEAGTYYLSVQSTNAKKGGSADYTVTVSDGTVFFAHGPDNNDSWETAEPAGALVPGAQIADGWVGFGDAVDYKLLTLNSAATLTLDCTATDAVKFTLFNEAGKSVANASLKDAGAASTKAALLEAGTYYLQVQSTNAKKGGSADYTVSVNPNTAFFTQGGDNNDSWETAEPAGEITAGAQIAKGWVGFGDAIDYKLLTLNSAATLTLDCTATDAVKFTLFNAAGKSVANASLKDAGAASTKAALLEAGTYYLQVQSTNAKKGGNADYTVSVNPNTAFFPAGDHTNDTLQDAAAKPAVLEGTEITGWVGFGDAADFIKFQVAGDGQIALAMDDATAGALSGKQIKLSCLDANGKAVKLVQDGNLLFSKNEVSAGDYYLGVTCANVKKFNTNYSITTGLLAV